MPVWKCRKCGWISSERGEKKLLEESYKTCPNCGAPADFYKAVAKFDKTTGRFKFE